MASDQQEIVDKLPILTGCEDMEPLAAMFVHRQFEEDFKNFTQAEFNSIEPIINFLIKAEVNKRILHFEARAVPDMESMGTLLIIRTLDWSRCYWDYIKKLPFVHHSDVFENEMTHIRSAINSYLKK